MSGSDQARTWKDLRVALAPLEIAGYYSSLVSGFRELGVECHTLMLQPHRFQYSDADPPGQLIRATLSLTRALARFGPRHPAVAARTLGRGAVLAHALRHYDVLIFGYGQTFFHRLDLPLLKRLGKKIVFVFHGSDSRPGYLNGRVVRSMGPQPGPGLSSMTKRIRRRLAWIARYADVIVDNPLSGHLHARPFINWFRIGLPCSYDNAFSPPPRGRQTLRVVHAPSDPESKGTPLIEAAIARACQRGRAIELIKLVGRPNSEVHEELARCDFVIDELYSDVPGASLAFEASSHGRATIVGGYAGDEFARWVPPHMRLPTHYCRPEQLDDAIELLASDYNYRAELGRRAYEFVKDICAPQLVAARLLQTITAPRSTESWLVDPHEISYVHGTGIAEEAARAAIRSVVESGSERALQVSDKPALLRRLREFAQEAPVC